MKRLSALAAAASLLLVIGAPAVQASSSPFTGGWTAADVDGSTVYLTISGGASVQLTYTDLSAPGTCAGAPISIFSGRLEGTVSGQTLNAGFVSARCGSQFLDGLVGYAVSFTYDPATDTLFGIDVTWTRG